MRIVYIYAGVNPNTGLYQFEDNGGNAYSSDWMGLSNGKLLSLAPDYRGGINNTVSYRGISLSVFIEFSKQLGEAICWTYWSPEPSGNLPVEFLNRWQRPGQITNIQKLTSSYNTQAPSLRYALRSGDYGFTDASYIRLNNCCCFVCCCPADI